MTRRGSHSAEGAPEPIRTLLEIMGQQEGICLKLLEIACLERGMLAESRLDDLEQASREKVALIAQMELLEAQRVRVVEMVAREMDMDETTSLKELSMRLAEPQRTAVNGARERIGRVVVALKDANDGNLETMRLSLDMVRESMRNLRRVAGTGETYDSGGNSRWSAAGMLAVDRRA